MKTNESHICIYCMIDFDDYNCNKNIIMTIHVSHHSKAIIVYVTSIMMTSKTHQLLTLTHSSLKIRL